MSYIVGILSLTASAVLMLCASLEALAQENKDENLSISTVFQTVEIKARHVKSTTSLSAQDIQAPLQGSNPLKSLEILPGVSDQTVDPWGNNEQNVSLFVHGYSTQKLGYTLGSGEFLNDSKLRLTLTNLANVTGDFYVVASATSNTTGGYDAKRFLHGCFS